MLCFLSYGELPFIDSQLPYNSQVLNIRKQKNKMTPKEICSKYYCEYLSEFMEKVYALEFKEEPDYSYLRFILEKNMMERDMYPSKQYDWTSIKEKAKIKRQYQNALIPEMPQNIDEFEIQ